MEHDEQVRTQVDISMVGSGMYVHMYTTAQLERREKKQYVKAERKSHEERSRLVNCVKAACMREKGTTGE